MSKYSAYVNSFYFLIGSNTFCVKGFHIAKGRNNAQGGKRVSLDQQIFDYGKGEYLITSVDLPISAQVTKAGKKAPMLRVGIALRPEAIANLLLEIGSAERHIFPSPFSRRNADDSDPVSEA
jgi:AraC-type transcriptional regulator N-terminus